MTAILLAHAPSHDAIRFGVIGVALLLFAACVAAAHVPHRPRGWFQ